MLLQRHLVHGIERVERVLEVEDQRVAPAARKVLAHDDAHQLHLLGVWRHRVGRHDPAALAQVVRDGELVVQVLLVRVQAAGDQRQALAARLGEDDEAEGLECGREVVGRADQVAGQSDARE